MSRLPLSLDRVGRLAEASLHVIGEERLILGKEERLLGFLDGLGAADEIELTQAQGLFEEAHSRFKAAKALLAEVSHRCEQKREIRERMRALITEGRAYQEEAAREISREAKAAGYLHTRPELLAECSPSEMATV